MQFLAIVGLAAVTTLASCGFSTPPDPDGVAWAQKQARSPGPQPPPPGVHDATWRHHGPCSLLVVFSFRVFCGRMRSRLHMATSIQAPNRPVNLSALRVTPLANDRKRRATRPAG